MSSQTPGRTRKIAIRVVAIGLVLIVVGVTCAGAAALVVSRYGSGAAFAAAGASVLAVVIGTLSFIRWPYTLEWDTEGQLVLRFLLRTETIAPADVLSYRKLGVTWDLSRTTGAETKASVFVFFRYRRPGRAHSSWAFTWLVGVGPAFSTAGEEFRTLLDERIPERQKRRDSSID